MSLKIDTTGHRVFRFISGLFLVVVALTMLVPMMSVFKDSLDFQPRSSLRLVLIPQELTLFYYRRVINDVSVYRPFLNSMLITAVGTALSLFVNSMAAYTMSRRDIRGNVFFVYFLVIIPMVVGGGGIIANFVWFRALGILNTYLVMILPMVAAGFYMIIIRTYYWSIPFSLTESAQLDGASEFTIYRMIIAPLSKAVYAAIALFAGVAYWNNWLYAFMFVQNPRLYPFPVKLRAMLFLTQDAERLLQEWALQQGIDLQEVLVTFEGTSSAIIMVAIIPVLLIYPYLQRHFAQGVRIGAIKG